MQPPTQRRKLTTTPTTAKFIHAHDHDGSEPLADMYGRELRVHLHYDPADPLTVWLRIFDPDRPDDEPTMWQFALALLVGGTSGPDALAGVGEVRVSGGTAGTTIITLISPDGVYLYEFRTATIVRFLARVAQAVPRQEAQQTVDQAIDQFLTECLTER